MDIQGKVAIVTGGASGIGAGLAKRFAAEGARGVMLADINLERAQGVASEIGAASAMKCDVSREADIQALVAATRERFGQVDIFMSNAGILGRTGRHRAGGRAVGQDVAGPRHGPCLGSARRGARDDRARRRLFRRHGIGRRPAQHRGKRALRRDQARRRSRSRNGCASPTASAACAFPACARNRW